MRKPVVIEKKDIMQISVTRNKIHSLRWLIRSTYVILLVFLFADRIMKTLQDLLHSSQRFFFEYIAFTLMDTILFQCDLQKTNQPRKP